MPIKSRNQGIMIILISIVVSILGYFILGQIIGESRVLNALLCIIPLTVSLFVRISLEMSGK